MNCKPGDLAVIVHDEIPDCIGRFVQVISSANPDNYGPLFSSEDWACIPCNYPIPVIDSEFGGVVLQYDDEIAIFDKDLRPIRDQDGEDEMIRIAGKPNKEKVDG